jgi:ATP-dependent DNA helicase RecG
VLSPGKLPAGITEKIYKDGGFSVPRNRGIAEIFHRLKIIERYGTGIKRIKNSYQEFKQSPIFEVLDGVKVKISLPIISYKNYKKERNDYRYQVLEFMKQKIETTSSEILKNVGGNSTTLKRVLSELVEAEKIRRVGKARATKYQYVK